MLLPVAYSLQGAVAGAAFSAVAAHGNANTKDPLTPVIHGAVYGAVLPQVIKVVHAVADLFLQCLAKNFERVFEFGKSLAGRATNLASANPAYALLTLAATAALVYSVNQGQKARAAAAVTA